ncbi:uncharacterized protein Dwil_GK23287 [Drosophila willistoni]|uniref:Uncharacterized protein n=1 Tax=Drosophila willistoni TaxID=7260 RepID=B4NNB9_DROWI|nr:uncharacterized protein LOC6652176 [Drosophila willistoni]EDW85858.1 uncharacterized protein Dwil_GK23287 [Drosophila willistoni]
MSYAAAVETSAPLPSEYNVKVTITPRVKKSPKSSQAQSKTKVQSQRIKPMDTRFSIFDVEQPKPHIILVDPKQFRPDQTMKLVTKKGRKPKKSKPNNQKKGRTSQLAAGASTHPPGKLTHKCIQINETPKESPTVKKKRLSASIVVSAPEIQLSEQPNNASHCIFPDDISYLGHHQQRLQLILERQIGSGSSISSPQIGSRALQPSRDKPRPMELVHLDMNKFRRLQLESAALLAQNRSMLCRWMHSDQLIS